jgi:hypothetical protein
MATCICNRKGRACITRPRAASNGYLSNHCARCWKRCGGLCSAAFAARFSRTTPVASPQASTQVASPQASTGPSTPVATPPASPRPSYTQGAFHLISDRIRDMLPFEDAAVPRGPRVPQAHLEPLRDMLAAPCVYEASAVANMFRLSELSDYTLWAIADAKEPAFWKSQTAEAKRPCLLAHCVANGAQGARQIAQHGFSLAFSQSAGGSLFGAGFYFTDSLAKAVSYSRQQQAVVLICMVDLGDCVFVDRNDQYPNAVIRGWTKKHPPEPSPDSGVAAWDSWYATNGNSSSNEFIVYYTEQVMPLYVLCCDSSDGAHCPARREGEAPDFVRGVPHGRTTVSRQTWGHLMSPRIIKAFQKERTASVVRPSVQESMNLPISFDGSFPCCIPYCDESPLICKLPCGHGVCAYHCNGIAKRGFDMVGDERESIKCPACNAVHGKNIGSCPDGTLKGRLALNDTVVELFMSVPAGVDPESGKQYAGRDVTAYLDSHCEHLLPLVRHMWKCRFLMRIGESQTTGQFGVVFGDVHLRTRINGGEHSLPDIKYPTSFLQECSGKINKDELQGVLPKEPVIISDSDDDVVEVVTPKRPRLASPAVAGLA